ncbi:trichothecene biosynthesis acetyltransferase [Penicillium sp. CMV-2018d]|nr:trichothecene biosynthesis acetyltransferase [Penicillium sp. CMV-2018d]
MDSFTHLQDILGQLPFLKAYSHLLLCFPAEAHQSADEFEKWHQSFLSSFKTAAQQLAEAVPWLAGKVIDDSGIFKVLPCSLWENPNSIVRFKDCRHSAPSYQEIVAARGAIRLLDGSELAPRSAFPESYPDCDRDPAPVLALQVNLVEGGILVDCAAQHNILDMMGLEQCLVLLATAMNDTELPTHAVEQANRDRRSVISLLPPDEPLLDHSQFKRTVSPPSIQEDSDLYSWKYYRFSQARLMELKERAAINVSGPGSYISTDDALSAFCWKSITAARLKHTAGTIAKTGTRFVRAVNARPALGVPREYMGDLVVLAVSHFIADELVQAPLSQVAATMRSDLQAVNHEDYIRSFATFLATEPDRSSISYGGNFNPKADIGSSSWAQVKLYRIKFGFLGKPTLVRRPNFGPLKSDIYFMPQTEDGDIDALLCMSEDDFAALNASPEWRYFADYIG